MTDVELLSREVEAEHRMGNRHWMPATYRLIERIAEESIELNREEN